MIAITYNANELLRIDRLIANASGKSMSDVLAHEARKTSWELYDQCKAIPPGGMQRARSLVAAATARGFRMGRRGDDLAPAQGGISEAAWKGARELLEGEKSSYFRIVQGGEGMPLLRRARFSARKSHKLLTNRKGRYAKSALTAGQIGAEALERELAKHQNLKRLNIRAVATANELMLRGRAAKGGTVAIQWLPKFYRKTKSATVKVGPLVSHNERTNIELGRVEFKQVKGELVGIVWTGNVPGTPEIFARHNIMEKVTAARVADRMKYLKDNLDKWLARKK